MKLEIRSERVRMRPEWHALIDAWVDRCMRYHPMVGSLEIRLRQRSDRRPGAEVEVVASAGRRRLRSTGRATIVPIALHDVLDSLENELLVHEAVNRAA